MDRMQLRLWFLGAVISAQALANVPLGGTQPGELTVPLTEPDNCKSCHKFDQPEGTPTEAAPYNSWAGSMMANAARDPVFLATLTIANQDVPNVGDFCIRCHAPQALLEERAIPEDGSALTDEDREGVHCEFCHRLLDPGKDQFLTGNGQYFVADDQVRRGPYVYPDEGGYTMDFHLSEQTALLSEARICGVCHDVTSPLLNLRDERGDDLGFPVPIERTYSEWLQSSYPTMDVTCQDCHLAEIEARGCRLGSPIRPAMSRHDMVGGNAWIPDVLAGEFKELDRADQYAYTKERAIEMLQSAATLELSAKKTTAPGEMLQFSLRVTNQTGHKLPTGYPEGRRMWLQVEAAVGDEAPFFASGAYDDDTGTLTLDDQIKVYEVKQAYWDGAAAVESFRFVLNDIILLDNRIPPAGFVPNEETIPRGASYVALSDGTFPNYDDTTYVLTVPENAQGNVRITARLLYQTSSKEYIEFVRDENQTDTVGDDLYALWETYGRSAPVGMADIVSEIENTNPYVPDAGVTDSGLADGGRGGGGGGCGCSLGARPERMHCRNRRNGPMPRPGNARAIAQSLGCAADTHAIR